jgi:Arm DNA-binding domain
LGQLTATRIKTLTEPGRYIDGEGLMMEIAPGGSRSWKLRVRVDGKRRDFGLGSLSIVTLTEAREKAREYRRLIALGIDPVAEKKKEKIVIPTFRAAAEQVHTEHKSSGSRPSKPTPTPSSATVWSTTSKARKSARGCCRSG